MLAAESFEHQAISYRSLRRVYILNNDLQKCGIAWWSVGQCTVASPWDRFDLLY